MRTVSFHPYIAGCRNAFYRSSRGYGYVLPEHQTVVYDAYWRFAAERQRIFFNRLKGISQEYWTDDIILKEYKFTNAYRASDRVSQYLINNVIYTDKYDVNNSPDTVFRILLFKIFNRISTWENLDFLVNGISLEKFTNEGVLFHDAFQSMQNKGKPLYSNAYLMGSPSGEFARKERWQGHLSVLSDIMKNKLGEIYRCSTNEPLNDEWRHKHFYNLERLYKVLLSCNSFGSFLAFQFANDLLYYLGRPVKPFVVAGPGAKSGIKKVFGNKHNVPDEVIIMEMWEKQEDEFERLELDFKKIGKWKLEPIDIQNLFCEIDKYSRIKYPHIEGIGDRTVIKNKFQPNLDRIPGQYPPFWEC